MSPFPPGDRRREGLRAQLRSGDADTLHVAFVSRHGAYRLLSYRLEPVRRQLDARAAAELRDLVMPQIRICLPRRPAHDGKRGRLQLRTVTVGRRFPVPSIPGRPVLGCGRHGPPIDGHLETA